MQNCWPKGTIAVTAGKCKCDERWTGKLCDKPVGWGAWSQWGGCDVTCGSGLRTQQVVGFLAPVYLDRRSTHQHVHTLRVLNSYPLLSPVRALTLASTTRYTAARMSSEFDPD